MRALSFFLPNESVNQASGSSTYFEIRKLKKIETLNLLSTLKY